MSLDPVQPPAKFSALPSIAAADPATGARAIGRLLPDAIALAESIGFTQVALLLGEALQVVERLGSRDGPAERRH